MNNLPQIINQNLKKFGRSIQTNKENEMRLDIIVLGEKNRKLILLNF